MNTIFKSLLSLTLILLIYSVCVDCHNVDTQFPIVFQSDIGGSDDNHFGLSVEMQSLDGQHIFVIGAPKTNSTLYNVRQSGTVFMCHLLSDDRTECREIFIDFRRIASTNRRSQKKIDIKPMNDMFLGGTVVGRPDSSQVVVCAHKWSQEFYRLPTSNELSEIIPTGSCYAIDLTKTRDTPIGIFPLTDRNRQFHHDTYYYSHSMSGFSAAFTSRGENLLLGAPGFYQWRGTFLETNQMETKSSDLIGEQFLLQKSRLLSDTESYSGYSIASGRFLAGIKNSVAVGAPRDKNLRGSVYIYNLQNGYHTEDTTAMFTHIDGLQIGEYFGATLLSINLNNDQFTDLVIGSPLYSTRELSDCGRVFVYLSNGKGFNTPVVLSASESSGSRFGTSLANLGDINLDGYNDLAIGAPYEDDNGVVYVYLGSRNGVDSRYAQRISAKEHFSHLNLKGFGVSIAGNKDVDRNFYKDIFVGSYLSNNAILLRTKPVVTVEADIVFNSKYINVNDQKCQYTDPSTRRERRTSCVAIRYCLRYDGSYVPSSLYFNINIEMDSKRAENPRCFAIINNMVKSQITKVENISAYKKKYCSEEFVVYMKDKTSVDDIFTPIEFSLSYSVVQLKSPQSFCSDCPMIANNRMTTNQLHFQTGCRNDSKCVSNLKLTTNVLLNGIPFRRGDSLLQGFHKNLTIIASVANTKEPSYLTKVLIASNLELNLLKQDYRCRLPVRQLNDTDLALIECDVGNPLRSGSPEEVYIPLDVSLLDSSVDRLEISIQVMTASEVTKDSHLTESIEINVIKSASIEIFGSSDRSSIVYETEANRKSDLIPFTGIFQITKQNWSSVDNVLIEIEIPSHFNKKALLFQPHINSARNAHNREPSFNCNRTIGTLPALPITSSDTFRFKRDVNENEYKFNGKTLKLNCIKKPISCQTMQCFAGPFGTNRQSLKFFFESALNIKTIELIFGKKYDSIDLIIQTKATILDSNIVSKPVSVSTNFLFKRPVLKKEWMDELWLILVSAVVGLLLLIAITYVLWKLGFFSRNTYKTNEEQNDPKSETDTKEISGSLLDFDTDDGFENNSLDT